MSQCEVTKIREFDADGNLQKAGLHWVETRNGFVQIGTMTMVACAFAFILTVGATSDTYGQRSGGAAVMFLITLGLFVIGALLFRHQSRKGATVFHRDGTIETPFGLPGYRERTKVGGSHVNIMSIESKAFSQTSMVLVYSVGGDTVCLAEGLTVVDAHKVAVQLVIALTEIRQSLADGTERNGPALPSVRPAYRALPLVN